jgi:hypothetical protein
MSEHLPLPTRHPSSTRVPEPLPCIHSAYYHGYVLAEMAVRQSRAHFKAKYVTIVDNPQIGRDLRDAYWLPGNGAM